MRTLLSLAALIGGFWLVYMGYERQQSIAGKTESQLSRLGQSLDGGPHTPAHVKYYAAGIVLVAGGALGLGLVRK